MVARAAGATPGFSGADLSALAREAAVGALRACGAAELPLVTTAHFDAAFASVHPSVSPQEEQAYLRTADKLRKARAKPNRGEQAKGGGASSGSGGSGGGDADGDGHEAAPRAE